MNPPCNRNKAYHPQEFDTHASYEGIGTTDCFSFGSYGEQGKKAFQAEQDFRNKHPEIRNVTPVSELHSWLNNSTCTVDACVPLLDDFANKYNCSLDELLNVVQRCMIQANVETANRLFHVTQTHKLYKQGAFEEAESLVQNPVIPSPIWTTESQSSSVPAVPAVPAGPVVPSVPAVPQVESSKIHHNMLRIKRTAEYNEYVSGLSTDELLLDGVSKIDPFTELNVQYLQKLCKRLGIRKYTTMNKDQMVDALTSYKSEYNSCSRFRFECFFKQVTCNGCMDDNTPCTNSKDLMNVGNYRWKYCPDHISNDAIKTWDCSVFSQFIDLKSNETLSSMTCDALFKNRTFEEIITHPSVQQSESTQKIKFPFKNNDQPLQKLKRTCPKKTKNGNIKTLLSKKKTSSNKKKCQLRMSDTSGGPKNTQTNSAKNKWTPIEEVDDIEEIEGPEEIEEPDETEINELEEEDDNESGVEDESEGDDDDGIDEDEQTEDNDEEEIDEEEDNDDKSLDIKISMPRQKRPKLIYHV